MLVSFIVPFYGSVPLLKRCLDSIVAQTDGDLEVLIVDDRSPENAKALVSQYDGRFRYFLQPENRGPYQGRVRGIEEARGEYVVDVDCDDYVKPELVAELRKAIERNHADIVIYNVEQDAAGVVRPHWCRYEPGMYAPDEVMARLVSKKLQWNFWSKAIRRETILKTWETEPRLRTTHVLAPDDFCATVPMVLQSEKIEVIPYVGHRYWQGAQSICRGMSFAKVRKAIRDTLEARRLVLAFADKSGRASVRPQVKAIARMISGWWVREYVTALKRRTANGFSTLVRRFELPVVLFPIAVTVLVSAGFVCGFRCAAWEWWAAVALTAGAVLLRDRNRLGVATLASFGLFLFGIWVASRILVTCGWWDTLAYHQPAIRLMACGWNPVWQGTPDGICAATGADTGLFRVWHVLSMPKGIWYFCAAAYRFTGAQFNLLFPLAPFMACAMAYAVWDLFRLGGRAFALVACLLSIALIVPAEAATYGMVVDYVVALATIGLLASMVNVLKTGEWHLARLAAFTFWLAVAKQVALFHGVLLWGVFAVLVLAVRGRRAGALRRMLGVGVASFVLFCLVSVSPYVTSSVNFGHPLYPQYGVSGEAAKALNITGDFLRRNEDAASMGRGTAYVNAFVSPESVRWAKANLSGRPDFCPRSVTWGQHEHSVGSPTTRIFRVCFCLSLATLGAFGGLGGVFVLVCLVLGTMAVPTEMLGYLRYTPWVLWGCAYGVMLLLSRLRAWAARWAWGRRLVCVGYGVFFVWMGMEAAVLCATEIERGYAVRRSMRLSPPDRLYCVAHPGSGTIYEKLFAGNALMLRDSVPALEKAAVEWAPCAGRSDALAGLAPYYENSFSVPADYDLGRFAPSWRPAAEGGVLGRLRSLVRTFTVILPRSILEAFHV